MYLLYVIGFSEMDISSVYSTVYNQCGNLKVLEPLAHCVLLFRFNAWCSNSLFDLEYLVHLFFIFIIILAFAAPGCNHMKEILDKAS